MDIITAYQELGSYRAAAKLCGTTDKTVQQIIESRSEPATKPSAVDLGNNPPVPVLFPLRAGVR
ncbi:MAG: hypothetical protein ACRD1G_05400 [Acidimicrobiales bacterium]